jgi:hypothetical protein
MNVLVILFGGVDCRYLEEFDCPNLEQRHHGKVTVDELWNDRDVATQITSQFITGNTWRRSGVRGRKRYICENTELIEKKLLRTWSSSHPLLDTFERKTRLLRRGFYAYDDRFHLRERNYMADDLTCETLFDRVPDNKAIYVPSYNPEPSWALDRNILHPKLFPSLGEEGALDLAEKNFSWRRKKLFAETEADHQLLVAQFQILDSFQHLYLVYSDEPQMDEIEEIYRRIDELAGEILDAFDQYDRVLFLSDNGAAHDLPGRTHYNRPFYSVDDDSEITDVNMRDFYRHVLRWVQQEPNASTLTG